MISYNKLKCILLNNYSKDIAYKVVRNKWSLDNKTLGMCAITSLIVNDYFGGIIKKCYVNEISHYYNEINNEIIDFTSEQFYSDITYNNSIIINREQMLSNLDTKNRYEKLLYKINKNIKEINEIDQEVLKCNSCNDLVEKFTNSESISYGKNTEIVILGEAPANNGWRKSGKAWYDVNQKIMHSGKILNSLLNIIDLELEDTTFIEAIKCFPKDRKYLKTCNLNCKSILNKQLKLLNPSLIITLGDSATKSILKIKYNKFSDIVGIIYRVKIEGKEISVLPIYHPSPISPLGYKGNLPIFNNLTKILNNEEHIKTNKVIKSIESK